MPGEDSLFMPQSPHKGRRGRATAPQVDQPAQGAPT